MSAAADGGLPPAGAAMPWTVRRAPLPVGGGQQLALFEGERPLTVAEVLDLWEHDAPFRVFFNDLLAAAPLEAAFWELPPFTLETVGRPFECVLVPAPGLAPMAPEPAVFAEHFAGPDAVGAVATFLSLGRDALLVAPRPMADPAAGAHLLAFVRRAPSALRHALWRAVGVAVGERLGPAPLWLSTSGLGVAWLHVRLDRWPKYITHAPYRAFP